MKIRRALLLFGGGIKRLLNLANLFSFEADHTTPRDGVLPVYKPYGGLGDFTVVRGSSATYVDSVGIIKEVLDNVARIDYTNGVAELLTEPQSTNVFLNSQDFDLWESINAPIVTPNIIDSPLGKLMGSKLENSLVDLGWSRIKQLNADAGGDYTCTVVAKKGSVSFVAIGLYMDGIDYRTVFDFDNRSWYNPNNSTVSYKELDDGWFELHVGQTSEGLHTTHTTTIAPCSSYNDYNGQIGDYIYLSHSQYENLSYATSYIPTNGSTVTRLQDTITDGGNVNVINSEEGVLFFEGSFIEEGGSVKSIEINSGASINRVTIQRAISDDNIRALMVVDSNPILPISYSLDVKQNNKIAFKWKQNDSALWVNGIEVGTIDLLNPFTPNVLNTINFSQASSTNHFFGRTRELKVYDRALDDSELETLTTL